MNPTIFIFSCYLLVTVSQAALPNVFNFEIPRWAEKEVKKTEFSEVINRVLTQYHMSQAGNDRSDLIKLLTKNEPQSKRVKVSGFQWKDCGGNAGKISKLTLSPDPLMLPGTITVSAGFTLNETLGAPLKVDVSLQSLNPSGKWEPIGCFMNFGSCNYTDICHTIAQIQDCPDPLVALGIDCRCPIMAGVYNMVPADFTISQQFLEPGQYKARVEFYYGSKKLICLDFNFALSHT